MIKRGLDVFVSAVLLLVSLPVLLLSALMIRITSPGPILFRQVRMGRGFRPFEILKFRTMAHGETGLAYTLGHDPRISPIGKWLRRTKLDEMPQLWNVLRGDMSMVGPRPVIPELIEEFHEEYSRLLKMRPGLTDPASLKYSQEARLMGMVSPEDRMPLFKRVITPDKLAISIEYADHATLWTEFATMAMTGVICCFPFMSRVYGETPDMVLALNRIRNADRAEAEMRRQEKRVQEEAKLAVGSPLADSPAATDDCIFAHGLVEVEAAAENTAQPAYLPWIALPGAGSVKQSTSGGADRSA